MPDKIENFNPNSYYNSPAPITQNFAFNIPSTIDASNIISKSTNTINAFKQAQNLKNFTNIGNIAGAAGTVVSSLLGDKREYSGTYGNVARTADSIYDTASDVISVIPGWGTAVSGIMKGAGALNQVMGKLGNSNDGMTVQDALLSSKIFNIGGLNPVSWVANGFGKKSISMENQDFISQERLNSNMDAYSGSQNTYESAMKKANKKYSLFSNGARHGANGQIRKANAESDLRLQVYDNNLLSQIRGMQQTSINNQGYQNLINGDLRTAAFGRKGLKLMKRSRLKNIINLSNEKILENQQAKNKQEEVEIPQNEQINLDNKEVIDSFQKGGKTENNEKQIKERLFKEWPVLSNIEFHIVPDSNFTTKNTGVGSIEYFSPEEEYMSYPNGFKYKNPYLGEASIVYNPNDNDYEDIKMDLLHALRVQDPKYRALVNEIDKIVLEGDDDLRSNAKLRYDEDLKKYGKEYMPFENYVQNEVDGLLRNLFYNGSSEILKSKRYYPNKENLKKWNKHLMPYIQKIEAYLNGTQAFKQGGQMNVIPEGALHARKNGMELAEKGEITHKGIPVVDNNGEQQAEIERNEVIFNHSTTTKIEELYKKFSNTDKESEKDEIAIKAGKILTNELINNTEDNTGLIQEIAEKNNLEYYDRSEKI